jgi:hypothetical protein
MTDTGTQSSYKLSNACALHMTHAPSWMKCNLK